MNALMLFEKNRELIDYAEVQLIDHPILILIMLYVFSWLSIKQTIDNHVCEITQFKKLLELFSRPIVSSAARKHLYRVYYQVQVWLGNKPNPLE